MIQKTKKFAAELAAEYRAKPWLLVLRVIVLLVGIVYFIFKPNFWTPDTLFIALLLVFIVLGQARTFIKRFLPFVVLLLVYDSFRGIADDLNKAVNFMPMIDFDRAVFGGQLPTTMLQEMWWHGHVQWYDFYFYFLYTLHFVAPVILAVIIWKKRDEFYWPFVTALVGLSFAGFLTYVLFPAAPPWMAAEQGYIEPIHRISSDIWAAMGITNFSEVYSRLSPNEVAAVPSLHAAYPLLFLLFSARIFGWRRVWWLAAYPVSVWIGIVYLGEHYVFDVVAGALYAWVAYWVVMGCMRAWTRLHPKRRPAKARSRPRRRPVGEKA